MPIRCAAPTPKAPVRAFWHNVDGVWHVAVPHKKLSRKPKVLGLDVIVHRRDGGTDAVTLGEPCDTLVFQNNTYSVHTVLASKTRTPAKRTRAADNRASIPSTHRKSRTRSDDSWFARFCAAADHTGDYDMEIFEGLEPEVGDRD